VESIDPVWLFGSIALVAGVFLGILGNRLLSPRSGDIDKLQAELVQAREAMALYKTNVNTHFSKTSDLVNELTQDYVKVYKHLAEGAQSLSDTREFTQVLDQPTGQVLISVAKETDEDDPVSEESPAEGAETTDPVQAAQADEPPSAPADYAKVDETVDETVDEKVSVSAEAPKADTDGPAESSKDTVGKNIDEDASKEKDAENADATVTAAQATSPDNQPATASAAESEPEKKT
jgi:uncharacterized membrane-anchored protein YhcB (DUF1043 family)